MSEFNPNEIGQPNGHYFALPYSLNEAEIALISVPWDVTTSFRPGTGAAPDALIEASTQVDLFDPDVPEAWNIKIGTVPANEHLKHTNKKIRPDAEKIIQSLEKGVAPKKLAAQLAKVNAACQTMNDYVYARTKTQLFAGHVPAVVGGEHSVPFGALCALSDQYPEFGILHIDAHADLREAYEGFEFSHASIMFNALKLDSVKRLVQVAVRDYCHDEAQLMQRDKRITAFTDIQLQEAAFNGKTWAVQTTEIITSLPQNVYISFDIDGLAPGLCPNTGTPVPGGLNYAQAVYLLKQLALSGRRIIGFDLCEAAPNNYDANIAVRLLYKLCCVTHLANRRLR